MHKRIEQSATILILMILLASVMLFAGACGGEKETAEPATATPAPTKPAPTSTPQPAPTDTPKPAPTATPEPAKETASEPSLLDMDINRAPGHSIGLEGRLEPGGAHRFLFLGSPGDTVGGGITSDSDMFIGIQDTGTGNVLAAVPNNDDSLFVNIPQNQLYHIVIEDASGQGGDYVAAFEASPKVSFALNSDFLMIGRLPEGGLLYYTFSGPIGSTLLGNAIPHDDTPIDLVVQVRDLESQEVLYEANAAGAGENEQFAFTVPDDGSNSLRTFIVSIEAADRSKGAYLLKVVIDETTAGGTTSVSPEDVVHAIFVAAQTGDFAILGGLCDPLGENDGDTQDICDLATNAAGREDFVAYFAKGKVSGKAAIGAAGDTAEVPFLFGPAGDKAETMKLINRDGMWYLFSF